LKAVILFPSSNYAVWAADVLKKAALEVKLISVPRQISSDCGYCVQIPYLMIEKAESILIEKAIEYDRIVQIKD
jgi:hypothetical protein